jgi:FtsZ-interacting cell division protein ZipA
MDSNTALIIVIAVVILAIGAYVAWTLWRRKQTESLRSRFGPEYDRAIERHGSPQVAEKKLAERARRVEKLNIRPLDPAQRDRFAADWRTVQARFVDEPGGAVAQADALVQQVMQARGYPVGDFEERAADLSVDHAPVVQNYRVARDIAQRHRRGEATTEDLRKAVVSYRALFEELLGVDHPELAKVRHG